MEITSSRKVTTFEMEGSRSGGGGMSVTRSSRTVQGGGGGGEMIIEKSSKTIQGGSGVSEGSASVTKVANNKKVILELLLNVLVM